MTGTLYGVGVGPGDPELLTVKAIARIGAADVVAYHAARAGGSIARAAAAPYLPAGVTEEELLYPVTRGPSEHVGGYAGVMEEFYAAAAERLAAHLTAGRDVALLAEGDPTLYSSFAHLYRRLTPTFRAVLVPGVTSVSASAAAAGMPLVEGDEVLTVVPATLAPANLAVWSSTADAVAFLKVSRNVDGVRAALRDAGRLSDAVLVSRASAEHQQVEPFEAVDADAVPYMASVLVPGTLAGRPTEPEREPGQSGAVTVVGLGPAGPRWLTPEARQALVSADDVVGYRTYVDRVPLRAGQRRHASENRVETERAEFALDLARQGRRVVVVSSGDPGVFGMATAVLEAQLERNPVDVEVRVLPGVTAANAVASRVGAPLGHDYCVISLSDQLKPWPVIRTRLQAAVDADLVLALYNPGSRARRAHVDEVVEVLLSRRSPDTPVVVGRAVGEPGENVEVVPLGKLGVEHVDMRTLLIVGSSTTRWDRDRGRVFTPRRYETDGDAAGTRP